MGFAATLLFQYGVHSAYSGLAEHSEQIVDSGILPSSKALLQVSAFSIAGLSREFDSGGYFDFGCFWKFI